jgi:hypothetical protein
VQELEPLQTGLPSAAAVLTPLGSVVSLGADRSDQSGHASASTLVPPGHATVAKRGGSSARPPKPSDCIASTGVPLAASRCHHLGKRRDDGDDGNDELMMENNILEIWRAMFSFLDRHNIPLPACLLFVVGLLLLILGISNGFELFGAHFHSIFDQYRQSSVLFGVLSMIVSLAWMWSAGSRRPPADHPVVNGDHPRESGLSNKLEKEFENEVFKFLLDIFQSHLDSELQRMAIDALQDFRQNQESDLPTCFLCSLQASDYLPEIMQTSIFAIRDVGTSRRLDVSHYFPTLSQPTRNSLSLDLGIGDIGKPIGLAGKAYCLGSPIKLFYNQEFTQAFVSEAVGDFKVNDIFPDFIPLKGVAGVAKAAKYSSTAVLPFNLSLTAQSYVICLDSRRQDAFVGTDRDDRLKSIVRYICISLEVQLFIDHLRHASRPRGDGP